MIVDLAFEGGGMKGFAFVGALRALADQGFQPGRLLGTSAGSLFAAFLAAGYDAEEMQNALVDTAGDSISLKRYFVPLPPFNEDEVKDSGIHQLLRAYDLRSIPDWAEESLDRRLIHFLFTHPAFREMVSFAERGGIKVAVARIISRLSSSFALFYCAVGMRGA